MAKKQKSRRVRLRRKNRRRGISGVLYRLACCALVIGAGAVAMTVFFKIDTINVTGTSRYQPAQIEKTLGVTTGDNLFLWGRTGGVQRLLREYPYIQEVKISCKLPSTLNVEIIESPAFAMIADGQNGCYLISGSGKLLEHEENAATVKLAPVTGVTVGSRKVGETLGERDGPAAEQLAALLSALTQNNLLQNVSSINLINLTDMHIGYQNRFDVRLGSSSDLARKLRFLQEVVDTKLSPSDIGVIDLSEPPRANYWPATLDEVQAAAGNIPAAPAVDKPDASTGTTQSETQPTDGAQTTDHAKTADDAQTVDNAQTDPDYAADAPPEA